jgi:hypothetical protein
MLSLKWGYRWIVLVLVVGALVLGIDYARKCHGAPLSKQEALQRGQARLERFIKSYHVSGDLPVLLDEQYEQDSKTWLLTYESKTCKLIVTVSRCHGDEVGSSTACH